MYATEIAIRDFLISKGVVLFWVDSHMNVIKQGLATNQYLPMHVIEQAVTVSKGHIKRYTATIRVRYPDTCRDSTVSLRYTFNPNARKAHTLRLNEH